MSDPLLLPMACSSHQDCQTKDRTAQCNRGVCVCTPQSAGYAAYGPLKDKTYVGRTCTSLLNETPLWSDNAKYPKLAWAGSADNIDYSKYTGLACINNSIVGSVYKQNPYKNCWIYACLGALNAWLCLQNNTLYDISPLPFLKAWQSRWPFKYNKMYDESMRESFHYPVLGQVPNVLRGFNIDDAMYIIIHTCAQTPPSNHMYPITAAAATPHLPSFLWETDGPPKTVSLAKTGLDAFFESSKTIRNNPPKTFFNYDEGSSWFSKEESSQHAKDKWKNDFSHYPQYIFQDPAADTTACASTISSFAKIFSKSEPRMPKGTIIPRFGNNDPWAVDNADIDVNNLLQRRLFYKQMLLQYGPFPIQVSGTALQDQNNSKIILLLNGQQKKLFFDNKGGATGTPYFADHAVLLVGYCDAKDSLNISVPYLIIKNSWGSAWGTDGGFANIALTNYVPYITQAGPFDCFAGRPQFFSSNPTCQTWLHLQFRPKWDTGNVKVQSDGEDYIQTFEVSDCNAGKLETVASRCKDNLCCERNYCKHGACIGPNTCDCYPGWTGVQCDQSQCDAEHPCLNSGSCIDVNVCECRGAWTGDQCQIP